MKSIKDIQEWFHNSIVSRVGSDRSVTRSAPDRRSLNRWDITMLREARGKSRTSM